MAQVDIKRRFVEESRQRVEVEEQLRALRALHADHDLNS